MKNLTLIIQLISTISAIFTSVVALINCHVNNKTVRDIELTKEKFAKENEDLKRKQFLQDEQRQLISNYLSATQIFLVSHMPEDQKKAIDACSQVLPILTDEQKKIVTAESDEISAVNQFADMHSADDIIRQSTSDFLLTLHNNDF